MKWQWVHTFQSPKINQHDRFLHVSHWGIGLISTQLHLSDVMLVNAARISAIGSSCINADLRITYCRFSLIVEIGWLQLLEVLDTDIRSYCC